MLYNSLRSQQLIFASKNQNKNMDASLDDGISGEDESFQNMKVTELRKELKARGLSTTGTKVELLERLHDAYLSSKDLDSLPSQDDDDDEEEEEEDCDDDINDTLDTSSQPLILTADSELSEIGRSEDEILNDIPEVTTKGPEVKPLKKRAIVGVTNGTAVGEKKIMLNRTSSVTLSTTTTSEVAVPKTVKTVISGAESKVAAVSKTNTTIKGMTSQERLAMRAQRFNITSSGTTKLTSTTQTSPSPGSVSVKTSVSKSGTLTKAPNVDILRKRAERFGENVSHVMKQIEEKERILKRKLRFSSASSSSSTPSSDLSGPVKTSSESVKVSSESVKVSSESVKVSSESVKERKKLRAERFGAL